MKARVLADRTNGRAYAIVTCVCLSSVTHVLRLNIKTFLQKNCLKEQIGNAFN